MVTGQLSFWTKDAACWLASIHEIPRRNLPPEDLGRVKV